MPDLIQTTPEQVPKVWPAIRDRVAFGVEKSDGRLTVEGLYEQARSGDWDLHLVVEPDAEPAEQVRSVFFTQVYEELNGERVCAMRFLTGKNRTEWVWLVEALELWAVQNGCDRMEMLVRRGWVRELRDYDYRQTHVMLEKHLKAKSNGKIGSAHDDNVSASAA